MSTSSPSRTRQKAFDPCLHGWVLRVVWCVWGAVVMLSLGLFLLGLPVRFHQLQTLSLQAQRALHGCSDISCLLLQNGLALNIYPALVLTQEILLVAGLLLVGLILFWRKSNHGPAMFFSVAMITYGPYITGSLDALLLLHPHWRLLVGLVQALGIGCAVLSGYTFPNGQFIPGWTRLLALVWMSLIVIWLIVPGFPLTFSDPYTVLSPASLCSWAGS